MNIWPEPCKNCPSEIDNDPESKEMRQWYFSGEITADQAIFLCAWRQTKYCRGVCDFMGIDEQDIKVSAKERFKNLCEVKKRIYGNEI